MQDEVFYSYFLHYKTQYMTKTLTSNDLLRFIYNETDSTETQLFVDTLSNDDALFAEYEALETSAQALPKVSFSPSLSTLQNIMNYSKATATAHC
jgi:hypothetical protein